MGSEDQGRVVDPQMLLHLLPEDVSLTTNTGAQAYMLRLKFGESPVELEKHITGQILEPISW
jgi:hypothetical protein